MKAFIDTEFTTVVQNDEETRVPDLGGYEGESDVQYSVMDRGDGTCLVRVTAHEADMNNIQDVTGVTVLSDEQAAHSLDENRPRASLENLDQPDVEVDELLNQHTIDEVLTDVDRDVANIVLNWSSLDREDQTDILVEYDADSPQELVEDAADTQLAKIVRDHDRLDGIPDHIDTATASRIGTQAPTEGGQVLQDQDLTAMDKVAKAKGRPNSGSIPNSSRGEVPENMSQIARDIVNGTGDAHNRMLEYIKGNSAGAPWK